jgi:hypothetical protein
MIPSPTDTGIILELIKQLCGTGKAFVSVCAHVVRLIDTAFNSHTFAINERAYPAASAINPILASFAFFSTGKTDHIEDIVAGYTFCAYE